MKRRVGVIDIGSNSIKALVAEQGTGPFSLVPVFEETLEVRISKGISRENPSLDEDRMQAGIRAVEELWRRCQQYGAGDSIRIVATSAVRSASNGVRFMKAVREATGCVAEILSGEEEAEGIALGVRTDASIGRDLKEFTVFDLGGGSLELIRFESGRVVFRTSLPLGSVRLTEHFFPNPEQPIPQDQQDALAAHVRAAIATPGLTPSGPLIGCSGGLAALRHCLAAAGLDMDSNSAMVFPRETLDNLTRQVNSQDIRERIEKSHIPPSRADIFPAALLTFSAIMDLTGAPEIIHSFHNLRYGIAGSLLEAGTA